MNTSALMILLATLAPQNLSLKWKTDSQDAFPVGLKISGDRIIIVSLGSGRPGQLDGIAGGISARSTIDGKVFWRKSLGYVGISKPVVIHGFVYFSFSSGNHSTIEKLDLASGMQIWSRDTPGSVDTLWPVNGTDHLAYRSILNHGIALGALSIDDGADCWNRPIRKLTSVDDVRLPAPQLYGGKIFALTADRQLRAINAVDGHELWHVQSWSHLSQNGEYRAISVSNNEVIAVQGSEIFLVDQANGEIRWRHQLKQNPFNLSPEKDGNFLAMDPTSLCSYRISDGSLNWRLTNGFDDHVSYGPSIWAVLYNQSADMLKVGRIDAKTGAITAETEPISFGTADMVQADNKIYLAAFGGSVYCFGPK